MAARCEQSHGAGEIDVDDLAPRLEWHLQKGVRLFDAGIVYQDVKLPEVFDGRGDEPVDVLRLGNIAIDGICATAEVFYMTDQLGSGLGVTVVIDNDAGAFLRHQH